MKKHLVIASLIFIVVAAISLASNFIPWDETPLEQTVFALPLGMGLLLELPFFAMLGATDPNYSLIGYKISWLIVPFVAGVFYAALYYYVVITIKRVTKPQSRDAVAS